MNREEIKIETLNSTIEVLKHNLKESIAFSKTLAKENKELAEKLEESIKENQEIKTLLKVAENMKGKLKDE